MGKQLRLHRFLPRSFAEGPGLRACIWVQGCSIACPGCAVPDTWHRDGGEVVDTDDIVDRIFGEEGLEGVTFVGGEPFEQPGALAEVGRCVRQRGLSVVTFTGRTLEDIRGRNDPECDSLLDVTDLLIDGPYIEGLPEKSRPWVGSANQRFHFLTDRYADLAERLGRIPNRLEIHVAVNGVVRINGMAPADVLDAFTPAARTAADAAVGITSPPRRRSPPIP